MDASTRTSRFRNDVKVSALVSTYDSERYMQGCLEDLTGQTLFASGQLEIVILDCASPGNEAAIARQFQSDHPQNITYVRLSERETLYGAWNVGAHIANGEYLTNANTDDRHAPHALERMLSELEKNPGIDLVYADVFRSDTPNQRFEENPQSVRFEYKPYFPPEALIHYQFGCQPMWRKAAQDRLGGFDGKFRAAGDYEFNLRFALAGMRALHIPEPLGLFLEIESSLSLQDSTSEDEQRELREQHLSPENILKLYEISGRNFSNAFEQATALHEFSVLASEYRLPWHPGESFRDAEVALCGVSGAMELVGNNPALLNNLGAILHSVGKNEDALAIFEQIPSDFDEPTVKENRLRVMSPDGFALRFCSALPQ